MRRRAPGRASEDEAYQQLRLQLLGGQCMVCPAMHAAAARLEVQLRLVCGGRATELHHRRKRSSSGAIAHPDNVVPSCHDGNMSVEDQPTIARAAGMVLREGDDDWERLCARLCRKANL